jgi:hypothetical protein
LYAEKSVISREIINNATASLAVRPLQTEIAHAYMRQRNLKPADFDDLDRE